MAALDEVLATGLVDRTDVARVVGASSRSVLRWQVEATPPRRDTEERLLELRAVLRRAADVMRDEPARLWLRSPVPELAWRKPLDIVAEGEFRLVIDALEALAEGVTA